MTFKWINKSQKKANFCTDNVILSIYCNVMNLTNDNESMDVKDSFRPTLIEFMSSVTLIEKFKPIR